MNAKTTYLQRARTRQPAEVQHKRAKKALRLGRSEITAVEDARRNLSLIIEAAGDQFSPLTEDIYLNQVEHREKTADFEEEADLLLAEAVRHQASPSDRPCRIPSGTSMRSEPICPMLHIHLRTQNTGRTVQTFGKGVNNHER